MGSPVTLQEKATNRLRKIFEDIDKDNSGSISIEEFTQACSELSIQVGSDEVSEFLRSDDSADGELDFAEFCIFYTRRLRKVFDEIDADGSGEIDSRELQRAFQGLGYKMTWREVQTMLVKVDADGSDKISFLEFCDYFSTMPSPSLKAVMEKWALGLAIDTGSDLAPPALPPSSVEIWKALVAGGIAGIVSRTFTAPLEKAKIIAQTQTTKDTRQNVGGILKNVWKQERWRGLFAGNGANCVRVFPFSALVCLAYYNVTKNFPLEDGSVRRNSAMRVTSGAMAGIFASFFTYPIDIVRAKLTVQDQSTKVYRGITDALRHTAKTDRFIGLYRGFVPTALSIAPFVAIQQISYDLLKFKAGSMNMEPSVPLFIGCGSIAGVTAQTVVFPLDVVRRRMQLGTSSGLTTMLKMLSWKELFGGISATYIKVNYIVYEHFDRSLHVASSDPTCVQVSGVDDGPLLDDNDLFWLMFDFSEVMILTVEAH